MKTTTLDTNPSSKTICMNYDDQEPSALEFKLVKEMIKGYKENQLKSINQELELYDSRLIWFDLETLKKFIYQIETETREIPGISKGDLGIHMYYSRYPNKDTWDNDFKTDLNNLLNDPITEQYEHRHTLIMIPTLKNKTEKSSFNMDINLLDKNSYEYGLKHVLEDSSNNYNRPISALGVVDSETINTNSKTINTDSKTVKAKNHGRLHPPYSSEGLAF